MDDEDGSENSSLTDRVYPVLMYKVVPGVHDSETSGPSSDSEYASVAESDISEPIDEEEAQDEEEDGEEACC